MLYHTYAPCDNLWLYLFIVVAGTACAEAEGEWPVGAGEHSTVQKMVLKRTNGKECLYFEGLSMMT